MRTINQLIHLYNSILNGSTIKINDYTLSSDGVNWLVDGEPVSTLNHKKKS